MAKNTELAADVRTLLAFGEGTQLSAIDAGATPGFDGTEKAGVKALARGAEELTELQEMLFAGREHRDGSVLLILQAMDTAGKGGIVRHVVGAVDPQGVKIAAFKKPTAEELAHDFLWRIEREVPPTGFIGVFDRSHYEDVLIGRVRALASPEEIERRYAAIVDFERNLVATGTRIVKVMLLIDAETQYDRLAARLDRPEKHWKYNPGDVDERLLWNDYHEAYQVAMERTSTPEAPWFVVPANEKWYARLAVQSLLIDAMKDIQPLWPTADYDVAVERARLEASGRSIPPES